MTSKRVWAVVAACLILCLGLAVCAETAFAQDSDKPAKASDKKTAQRTGVSGSLASGDDSDDKEGPSALQMGLGIGSCVVMIAVVKFL